MTFLNEIENSLANDKILDMNHVTYQFDKVKHITLISHNQKTTNVKQKAHLFHGKFYPALLIIGNVDNYEG